MADLEPLTSLSITYIDGGGICRVTRVERWTVRPFWVGWFGIPAASIVLCRFCHLAIPEGSLPGRLCSSFVLGVLCGGVRKMFGRVFAADDD